MSIPAPPVIDARGLTKRFGDVVALSEVTLTVGAGEILGVLGPNGAGKTTAVRLLTTLLQIDGGAASVAGFDVATQPRAVRASIGLAGQAAAVDEKLTAKENLEFFARLYKLDRATRRNRVAELVERFDLGTFADRPAATYSGGQRRRLDIAAALVAAPPALFLDEPTTGLDPRSRAEVWEEVRSLATDGAAILLTTQYLEEADRLADRILVIDRGREVASGLPADLKGRVGRDILEVRLATTQALAAAQHIDLPEGTQVATAGLRLSIPIDGGANQSLALLRRLGDRGVDIADFAVRRPTLDDAFLALTGEHVANQREEDLEGAPA